MSVPTPAAAPPDAAGLPTHVPPDAPAPAPLAPGTRLRLRVGAVAHGGHCVARIGPDAGAPEGHLGRVVFVRGALPGEDVTAVVTEDGPGATRGGRRASQTSGVRLAGFLRADAVEVHQPVAGRVEPPCPHALPGRCGGCDLQHADADTQHALKAHVVRDALQRFAGLDLDVRVEPLPGGLLGWRTRTAYAVDRSAGAPRLGLRRHRSHEVEPLEACPISAPGAAEAPGQFDPRSVRHDVTAVEVVLGEAPGGDGATRSTVVHRPAPAPPGPRRGRGRRPPDRTSVVDGPADVRHTVGGRAFTVPAAGFWQVHPHAAATFTAAALDALQPRPGERALDLYAGAGLFTALLAGRVGPGGAVAGVEVDAAAVGAAADNLADLPWAAVHRGRVDAASVTATVARLGGVDVAVLDPPRAGAGADVVAALLAAAPRAVAYVACDPVALARDLATALAHGYRVADVRAFDAFPMTHHVECVALLVPADGS